MNRLATGFEDGESDCYLGLVDLLDDLMTNNTDGHEDKENDLSTHHDDRVRGGVVTNFDHQVCDGQKDGDDQKRSPAQ